MGICDKDRKLLWGKAAGKCSICKKNLCLSDKAGILGVEAHIVAKRDGGPRGDSTFPKEKIDSYENLILFSPDCHTIVDSDVDKWTKEKLLKTKTAHEDWVKENISREEITEISGRISVDSTDCEEVIGVDIQKPTRIKPGTIINVKAKNVKNVTGLKISGGGK